MLSALWLCCSCSQPHPAKRLFSTTLSRQICSIHEGVALYMTCSTFLTSLASLLLCCAAGFWPNHCIVTMQPSRTPRKQPQHLARAFSALAHVPSASKPVNSRRGHGPTSPLASPPDSPRSTGGFSAFSDGDWEENLADNVKVTVCKLGGGGARAAGV